MERLTTNNTVPYIPHASGHRLVIALTNLRSKREASRRSDHMVALTLDKRADSSRRFAVVCDDVCSAEAPADSFDFSPRDELARLHR